jgi:hypothetical protein
MRKISAVYSIVIAAIAIMVVVQLLSPSIGELLSSMLTILAGVIGVVSVVYEMKRSADISQAEFILELQKFFQESDSIQRVYAELDKAYAKSEKPQLTQSDRADVVAFLSFLETITTLISIGTLKVADADSLLSYPFFLCCNATAVQALELKQYPDYYRNVFKVYPQWLKYRQKHQLDIPWVETALV